MKVLISLSIYLAFNFCNAQIPQERLTDWHPAGNVSEIYNRKIIVSLDSFGGKSTADYSNDTAMEKALKFLNAKNGGTIDFNEGTYLFLNTITLSDSITLKGKGTSTILNFDLKGNAKNCINLHGSISGTKKQFDQANRGNRQLILLKGALPESGAIIELFQNDSNLAFSNWAYGSIGQLARVINTDSNKNELTLQTPLRLNFNAANSTFMKVVKPIQNVSIECLKISRVDSTSTQTSHISFNYAFNCKVKGVESANCHFGHIVFENSLHNEVIQSYLHDAFAYGGDGQGYGVVMQSTSSDNKIENNILQHLRHSILVQSGANGNVIGYNFSRDTYWSDNALSNAAGDLVCHGNYAHHNLFEGNICQNIIVDNSHGKNGPHNTYFRNRAELYGIIVSNGQDSQNFIANEIINTGPVMGQYIISGNGNLTNRNNVKGTFQSNTILSVLDSSLYLRSRPAFLNNRNS